MSQLIGDELQQLFDEVDSLAVALRRFSRSEGAGRRISVPGRAMLCLISNERGVTVPRIARLRGTSRQNVQSLANRLAAAGLVEYVANPDHRRSERLRLTESGRRSLRAANQVQAVRLTTLLPHVSEEAVLSCIALLSQVRAQFGIPRQARPFPSKARRRTRSQADVSTVGTQPVEPRPPAMDVSTDFSPPEELPVSLL